MVINRTRPAYAPLCDSICSETSRYRLGGNEGGGERYSWVLPCQSRFVSEASTRLQIFLLEVDPSFSAAESATCGTAEVPLASSHSSDEV